MEKVNYTSEGNMLYVEFAKRADLICRNIKYAALLASEIYSPEGSSKAKKLELNKLIKQVRFEMSSQEVPFNLKVIVLDTNASYVTQKDEVIKISPPVYTVTDFIGIDPNGIHFGNRQKKTEYHLSGFDFEIREVTDDEISQGI